MLSTWVLFQSTQAEIEKFWSYEVNCLLDYLLTNNSINSQAIHFSEDR